MRQRTSVMEKIEHFAGTYYAKLDFAHNIGHGQRVVEIAKKIMEKEGGDSFLVEAGAWLHQLHDDIGALEEFLSSLEINDEARKKIRGIVTSCKPDRIKQSSSLEAKIVFDSDGIEVVGPYGSVRELLCNAKARNKLWDESVKETKKVQKMFEEKLMTKTAKKLAKESIEITRRFWDCYDRWRRLDLQ
jgi:HD superfamily phosphodiesterase